MAPEKKAEEKEEEKAEAAEGAKEPAAGEEEPSVEEAAAVDEPAPSVTEKETDAVPIKGAKLKETCTFHTEDTTLNVLPAMSGKHLMALSEGGFQYLLAGARGSVGLKGGRYMFEVMIVERKQLLEGRGQQGPQPKSYVRVGFATEESSLIMCEGEACVYFDSIGNFGNGTSQQRTSKSFSQGQAVAVVLNLDESSPNANTISLFCDGVRIAQPQPLPDAMKGKVLYPSVTYRNTVLQVSFGGAALRPLPFKCLSLQEAAAAHCVAKKAAPVPKDGKHQVMVPVGLPDEGTFEWLDEFLAKNRHFAEISDRAFLDWAAKSGLKNGQGHVNKRSSNDKPEFNFGLQLMDDYSLQKVLASFAPLMPRNLVVMEVKQNLTAEGRKQFLDQFSGAEFKKVATVVMGDPPAEWQTRVREELLKDKKVRLEAQAARKKAEAARKKAAEEAKRKREADRKKLAEERAAKKAKTESKDAGEGDKDGKEKEEKEENEDDAEAKKPEEEEEAAAEEEAEEKEEPIVVELTEGEKQARFKRAVVHDLTPKVLSSSYATFTLPTKEEGFDEISYAWQKEAGCKEYLASWIAEKKLTQRVEDLQVSEWFRSKHAEWTKALAAWRKAQQEFKNPAKKKKGKAPPRPGKAPEAKKEGDEEMKEEEVKQEGDEAKEEKVEEEAKEEPAEVEEEEKPKINVEELDVFSVDDVADCGNGQPLFSSFQQEDWALVNLRFELHLLVHAFRHDLNDPERTTFHERHLVFYYNRYYKKTLNPKNFSFQTFQELLKLVEDTMEITPKSTMEAQMPEDTPLDVFVRLAEDDRRERNRRIDTGDKTAVLKFPAQAQQQQQQQHWGGNNSGGKGGNRGGKGGQWGGGARGSAGAAGGASRGGYSAGPSGGAPKGSFGSGYASGVKRAFGGGGGASGGSGYPSSKRPTYGGYTGGARVGGVAPPPPPPPAAVGPSRAGAGYASGGYGGGYARDSYGRR